MRKRRSPILLVPVLALLTLLLAVGATAYTAWAAGRITGQQTLVMAPEVVQPESAPLIRAIVQDFNTGAPLPKAAVTMRLVSVKSGESVTVYEGRTDEHGSVAAQVKLPEGLEGAQRLVVETRTSRGSSKLERSLEVRREAKLLLTTDKPLYQPGQTIHIRALGLNIGDLTPVSGEIEFVVEDPKGNKVHRQATAASAWGIASLDFTLASEVNFGAYKVVARYGETTSEKTVTVKPYVLPKFGVKVQTDRAFYQPGQRVEGTVQADYFFGKPVSAGQVEIVGYVRDVDRREALRVQGVTDEQGRFAFSFEMPAYFVGGAPEAATATLGLEVTVIDQADHAEQTSQTLPVSEDVILLDAVPESGELKSGVENVIYLLATYPDGAPAAAQLAVRAGSETFTLDTGAYGLATLNLTPAQGSPVTLEIEARDAQGNRSSRRIELPWQQADEYVLLRPERAAYVVGETMRVEVLASAGSGTAYLDIIREGQTLSTRALELRDGVATAEVDLDEAMFGTLQLHAYKVLRDATIVRDTRLVVVDRATDIALDVSLDKETYLPGDVARLAFQTRLGDAPVPAALGVSIVDESVFALQEQEAGFAKLYFLLQAEILEPRYQLKWFQPEGYFERPDVVDAKVAQERASQALLAGAGPEAPEPLAESRREKQGAIQREQRALYDGASQGLTWAIVALSGLGLLASVVMLARRRELGRGLGYGTLGLLALLGLGALLAGLIYLGSTQGRQGPVAPNLVLFAALAGLALLIVAGVLAWRRRDREGLILFAILLTCFLLLPLLVFAASHATDGWEGRLLGPVAALGLVLLGLYLHHAGLLKGDQRGEAAVGLAATGLLLAPIVVVGAAYLLLSGAGGPRPEEMNDGAFAPAAQPLGGRDGFGAAGGVAQFVEKVVRETVVVEKETSVENAAMPAAGTTGAAEPPRLRQFFPETMYWNPQVLTDDQGRAEIEVPMADSITTWRLSALASSQRGELGNATAGLRVFQDFFIDLDLPLYLTQNDEVALPVAVFNYLPHEQQVRLVVEEQSWFELLDEREKTMTIASNDVEAVYFRIRVLDFGLNDFQVTAWGEAMSDAILKRVQVVPDGKAFRTASSDNLRETVQQAVWIPEAAIPGTAKVWVKLYPGIVSQIVEGLSGLLRMPFG